MFPAFEWLLSDPYCTLCALNFEIKSELEILLLLRPINLLLFAETRRDTQIQSGTNVVTKLEQIGVAIQCIKTTKFFCF